LGLPNVVVTLRPHPELAWAPDAVDVDLNVWPFTRLGNLMRRHGRGVTDGGDSVQGESFIGALPTEDVRPPATKSDRASSRVIVRPAAAAAAAVGSVYWCWRTAAADRIGNGLVGHGGRVSWMPSSGRPFT
jgi:hypothetical protein